MKYEKIILTSSTTVAGNIKDHRQSYDIKYYPKANDLIDKVALYIYLGEEFAKRSVYFSSTEQLKTLVYDLTQAYFYFLDKRKKELAIPREEFRRIRLDNFLYELRKKQLKNWKNEPRI